MQVYSMQLDTVVASAHTRKILYRVIQNLSQVTGIFGDAKKVNMIHSKHNIMEWIGNFTGIISMAFSFCLYTIFLSENTD